MAPYEIRVQTGSPSQAVPAWAVEHCIILITISEPLMQKLIILHPLASTRGGTMAMRTFLRFVTTMELWFCSSSEPALSGRSYCLCR